MIQCDAAVKAAMIKAVAETMENMAFEQVEEAEPGTLTISGNDILWASLSVIKPSSAEVGIELSGDYARAATEALFGFSDEGPAENIVHDALAEMLNTIAGRFMAQLTPAQQEFELGLPQVGRGKKQLGKGDVATLEFNIGEHLLKVYLAGLNPETGELSNSTP